MASYVEIIRLFLSSQTLDFRKNTPAYAGNTSDPSSTIPVFRDRPRAGSPPLARGIHPVARWIRSGAGITPACAGNTYQVYVKASMAKDHPRLRGEYRDEIRRFLGQEGSPPLARGIRQRMKRAVFRSRITPACAGNTLPSVAALPASGDHPRLRGEYRRSRLSKRLQRGSPPLARGIPIKTETMCSQSRITPACAGNTKRSMVELLFCMGSPPLARGIHNAFRKKYFGKRITPACAGNTLFCRFHSPTCKDHPRLRGEYYATDFGYLPYTGSPPLARGILTYARNIRERIRITPACAGNTQKLGIEAE